MPVRPSVPSRPWFLLVQTLLFLTLPMTGMLFGATLEQLEQTAEPSKPSRDPQAGGAGRTLQELEQPEPATPQPPSAPQQGHKEKTQDQLRNLDEQGARDKTKEREQQTPKERAREKVRTLERTDPAKEDMQGLESPEPENGEQTPEGVSQTEGPGRFSHRERVKTLLGMHETQVGIYDEILDKTKLGPNILHDALRAPRWLVLGGDFRTRYEALDGSWRANEPTGGQLLSMRTRLQLGIQNLIDPVRFLVEFQDVRAPYTTSGAYINTSNVNELDFQQLHLDFFSKNFLGTGIPTILKIGRVNMDLGRGRWVGRNTFRNVANAFDGFEWQLGDERRWQLRSFLVQPTQRFLRKLDPLAAEGENTFWGVYFESRQLPWFETTFHYYGNSSEGPARDFNMLGGRIRKQPKPGKFDYEIESSYQFGNITPQTQFAHFQHGELGYTFDLPWTPQVLSIFDYSSNGFDIVYGRRSFELTPTGIFGPFQRSNIVSPGTRLLIKPIERTYVYLQYRAWWLANDQAAWVGTGIRDPTGNSGNFVGQTVELRARWGLNDNIYLQGGYVYFAYGPFAENAPNSPVTRNANYGYLWLEFMF